MNIESRFHRADRLLSSGVQYSAMGCSLRAAARVRSNQATLFTQLNAPLLRLRQQCISPQKLTTIVVLGSLASSATHILSAYFVGRRCGPDIKSLMVRNLQDSSPAP